MVGIGYGPLRLEVNHIPHSSDDVPDSQLPAAVHSQIVVGNHRHSGETAGGLPYDVQSFFLIVKAPFVGIYTHGHHHLVEHGEGAFENVEVTGRERVERTREKGSCHFMCSFFSHLYEKLQCPVYPAEASAFEI